MPSVSVLAAGGSSTRTTDLDDAVFAAEIKPHLVHEVVRAELNAERAGTRGAKSRGLVAGGRTKPWRQKGTGRARAGTTRAPQFTGGGVAFPPTMRTFDQKVNKKVARAALRAALAAHVGDGTLALLDASAFDEPSTRNAVELLESWGKEAPLVVVVGEDEEVVAKSFRNLARAIVVAPSELRVSQLVRARSLLITEGALELIERRAAA
jgi:large subunit ribosomal protein L4